MKKYLILHILILFTSCSIEEVDKNNTIPSNGLSSLIETLVEGNCITILTGLDINENGRLDTNETTSSDEVCGQQGYNSLVDIQLVNGCNLFNTGLDLNEDLVLQDSEILQSQYLCPLDPVDGISSLVDIQTITDVNVCSNGGYYVFSGLDINGNGTLEESERETSAVLCNGENGQDGEDGTNGQNGNSIDFIFEGDCYTLIIYEDENENGVFDNGELVLNTSDPVCLQEPTNGSNSLVTVDREDNCITINSGLDLNSNNILETSEITASETICTEDGNNGQNGNNSLVVLTDLEVGSTLCEHGGVIISVGIDDNGDNVLQPEEIDSETVICNLKCVHEPECVEEDFVYTFDFEEFNTGDIVNDLHITEQSTCDQTVTVQGMNPNFPNDNMAMIFDSTNPTGGDTDLYSSYLGNLLIVSEDGDSNDPDDAAVGDSGIILIFEVPTDVLSIKLIDADHEYNPVVKGFDIDGNLVGMINIPLLGENSIQTLDLNFQNVKKLKVWFEGSMAMDDLKIKCTKICN